LVLDNFFLIEYCKKPLYRNVQGLFVLMKFNRMIEILTVQEKKQNFIKFKVQKLLCKTLFTYI